MRFGEPVEISFQSLTTSNKQKAFTTGSIQPVEYETSYVQHQEIEHS